MSSTRMPALFLGHGSPMNVLEDNVYTRAWGNVASPESHCGGLGTLVHSWDRCDGDGSA